MRKGVGKHNDVSIAPTCLYNFGRLGKCRSQMEEHVSLSENCSSSRLRDGRSFLQPKSIVALIGRLVPMCMLGLLSNGQAPTCSKLLGGVLLGSSSITRLLSPEKGCVTTTLGF